MYDLIDNRTNLNKNVLIERMPSLENVAKQFEGVFDLKKKIGILVGREVTF
jgi:hypothetical protein